MSTRILFIKPHWRWSKPFFGAPPIGLMMLSSMVKQFCDNTQTRLLDLRLTFHPYDSFRKTVEEYQPDIIAITSLAGDEEAVSKLSSIAKTDNPKCHIACGGPLATIHPESVQSISTVDSIICGEGEIPFVELVRHHLSGEASSPDVKGLSIRSQTGILSIPEKSDPVTDLDDLPFPDWDIISIDDYSRIVQMNGVLAGKRYMPVFTSRGCPYHCTFCHNLFGTTTRFRSVENMIEEIQLLTEKYGVDEIQIVDDIFNLNRNRVLDFCNLIIKKGIRVHISFPNGIRGDRLDNEMIVKLKQAGTYMITFAFESASPRIQKMINKNLNIDKTLEAVRYANSIGLITKSFFMVGFPGETKAEVKHTLNFAASSPLTTLVIFMVTPFKGTALYDQARHLLPAESGASFDSYFSSRTFYTETTGIRLKRLVALTYMRFFTPVRLAKFFIKIPNKKLYLRHLKTVISVIFMPKRIE